MNLLIVDDDPTSLKLLRAQLESEGHAIFEAHDGVDALAMLERQRVDAVISDVLMPRMDGYRLCHEIRKHARLYDLPIIIYTSTYISPGDEKLALNVGADKYLKKPRSVEIIIAALNEVIAVPYAARHPKALQEVDVPKEYSEKLVSKLKEKNTELQAAEVKFRTLVEQSIVGIYILQDDRFVYVNPRMLGIFGWSEEEMTSRTLSDFIVPEDQALARENIRKRISGEVPDVHYYLRMLHQSGAVLQVDVHGSRTEYNGRPAVMGTLVDITERKRAEEGLKESKALIDTVVDNIPFMIFLKEAADLRFVLFNRAGEEVLGYDRKELLGKNDQDFFPPEQVVHFIAKDREVLDGKSGVLDIPEEQITTAKKGERWFHTRKVCIRGADGSSKYLLGISEDITDRKRAAEELAQSLEQLRQSQKIEAVGRLAGGIAHDFNNLLTVIIGYCELMATKIGERNPLREDVEEIHKSADRAAALTRQLLAFSRRQILQPKVLEIDDVVPEMDKMLRRLISEDVNLVTNLGAGGGKVKVDPGQIEQVIVNLVINSRDAMPDGGTITIETAAVELDEAYVRAHGGAWPGPHVMLAVSDTGCGMDPETLSKAFEPFFTTKEKGKGTGLGLSTVYGIVKQSGGCLYCYSEPGRGTTMKIYLPRVTGETAPKDERRDAGFDDRLQGSETVLLVEDEETLRKLASSILEGYGYTVLSAGNGEEALQLLNNSPAIPRLLVTDVVMPKMGGRELSDRIKAIHPGTQVLFMSGYTDNAIVHHGVLDQGVSYLPKPFTPKALARKVREVLDKK